MPDAAKQNTPYAENRDELENARISSLRRPNEETANDPQYRTKQQSAHIIPFPKIRRASAPQERVSFASFAPAFMTALLKDLLDFAFITSLFGIGTLLTACCSILIALFIFLFPKRRYRTLTNTSLGLKELLLIMGVGAFEGLVFPANLLPATIGLVYAIYLLEKQAVDKRNAKKLASDLAIPLK